MCPQWRAICTGAIALVHNMIWQASSTWQIAVRSPLWSCCRTATAFNIRLPTSAAVCVACCKMTLTPMMFSTKLKQVDTKDSAMKVGLCLLAWPVVLDVTRTVQRMTSSARRDAVCSSASRVMALHAGLAVRQDTHHKQFLLLNTHV
jgi:hypothetical protein